MKIKYFILSIIMSAGIFTGCNNLDYNEVVMNDAQWLYDNQGQVQRLLAEVYAKVSYDMGDQYLGAMLASATDEADFPLSLSTIHRYYNGAWSSVNAFPFTWSNSFQAIYSANIFLENLDKVFAVLETYKHNVNVVPKYEDLLKVYELFPYQARFLRAYFYFELAKTYGDVPLITRTLTPEEANLLSRKPVQEIFKFIVSECDNIAEFLPIDYSGESGQQIGRINRPTVYALKARTLLYAASPLFNPETSEEVTKEASKEAWRKAAVACKELIDACVGWGIEFTPYQNLWPNNSHLASEILWTRRIYNSDNRYENYNFPVGEENAVYGGNCPSQNLVDAYEYTGSAPAAIRGKTWPEAEALGALPANPYANLDPRFGHTIAKNADTWPTTTPYNYPLQIFEGGRNAPPILNATKTGYYLKKYMKGGMRITQANSISGQAHWIIYRLSEFYLNYAEAMFNYMDNDATAVGEGILSMSANDAINVLRNRDGIKMPLFTDDTNGDVWVERYQRERMVELAFEGHRFWDVRRWKIYNEGDQMNIKTIKINVIRDEVEPSNVSLFKYTYQRGANISRGTWYDRYYFYPIPQTEIQRATNLVQNDNW